MIGDEYLAPVVARFGPHQGLNADWATMAWCVAGSLNMGIYICDDESADNTVSIVARYEVDGDTEIIVIRSGKPEAIIEIAMALTA
jgi:hypothetical protein